MKAEENKEDQDRHLAQIDPDEQEIYPKQFQYF